MRSLEVTRSAWAAATLAWSRDDAADTTATILLGERMMFAATDHIVGLEALEDAVRAALSEIAGADTTKPLDLAALASVVRRLRSAFEGRPS